MDAFIDPSARPRQVFCIHPASLQRPPGNLEAYTKRMRAPKTRGTSLIELLTALAIVLILAATALYSGAQTLAHVRIVLGDLG